MGNMSDCLACNYSDELWSAYGCPSVIDHSCGNSPVAQLQKIKDRLKWMVNNGDKLNQKMGGWKIDGVKGLFKTPNEAIDAALVVKFL